MVTFHNGNILDSGADIICHQVNCQGKMNSGVAKAIREKWPEVYTRYRTKYECEVDLLGQIQPVIINANKAVINMFAQYNYGYDGRRYTSYDAFWNCLWNIKFSVPKGSSIGFPFKVGCGLGGANWNVIKMMICEVLGEDYKISIYNIEKE